MKPLESKVQSNLIEELNKLGWAVLRLQPTGLHLPNQSKVMKNGLPDLLAFKKRAFVFVEVKRGGGTYDPLQYIFRKILKGFGVRSVIYRAGEDIELMMKKKPKQ